MKMRRHWSNDSGRISACADKFGHLHKYRFAAALESPFGGSVGAARGAACGNGPAFAAKL
jgi:hypothetical protein